MKSNRPLLGIPTIPHGIITLRPLLPNPTALSHNPSPWASRTGLPACLSERSSDLNVRHLRGGMTNTARYSFLRAPRRFQASQPVGRKIVAQCVSTGRTTLPRQPWNGAEETRAAVLLSPRSGAGKRRPACYPRLCAVGYYLAPFGLCAVADGGGAEERRCPGRTPPAYAAVLQ